MADEQFAGRGQRDSEWIAKPGLNLTFSIYLTPEFLPVQNQFLLNMAISIGISAALSAFTDQAIKTKWPNDIYFNDLKIGGVLIENTVSRKHLKSAIIGIGINVNQRNFRTSDGLFASSLSEILHQDVDLLKVLMAICAQIEFEYEKLRSGVTEFLRRRYMNGLYRYNLTAPYKTGMKRFEGKIVGVTDIGELILEVDGNRQQFGFKEIEFLRLK